MGGDELLVYCFCLTIQTGWRSDSSLDFSRMGFKQGVKDCVVCWVRMLQDEGELAEEELSRSATLEFLRTAAGSYRTS